jgi:microcystin-dependent protein
MSANPQLGEIVMFAGNFAPRGWAFCQGQLLAISQNTALFSLLGTTYGGDGRTTFALPDLRGRIAIHHGRGPGLSDYRQGQRGGVERVTLLPTEIPAHSHTGQINTSASAGSESSPAGNYIAAHPGAFSEDTTGAKIEGVVTGNTGGNQPHNNMQPYLAVNYIIALQGTYPSRN